MDEDRPFWKLDISHEELLRLLESGGGLTQEQLHLLQPDELEEYGHLRTLMRYNRGLPLSASRPEASHRGRDASRLQDHGRGAHARVRVVGRGLLLLVGAPLVVFGIAFAILGVTQVAVWVASAVVYLVTSPAAWLTAIAALAFLAGWKLRDGSSVAIGEEDRADRGSSDDVNLLIWPRWTGLGPTRVVEGADGMAWTETWLEGRGWTHSGVSIRSAMTGTPVRPEELAARGIPVEEAELGTPFEEEVD